MPDLRFHVATEADIADLAAMIEAFNVEDGGAPGYHTTETVRRDGFGYDPAFAAVIARDGRDAVGFALYFPMYNTEIAARGTWLMDLWVAPTHRGHGVGRKLMAAVAAGARERGEKCVWWGVRSGNTGARKFYASIDAHDDDARLLELSGDAFERLAREGEGG